MRFRILLTLMVLLGQVAGAAPKRRRPAQPETTTQPNESPPTPAPPADDPQLRALEERLKLLETKIQTLPPPVAAPVVQPVATPSEGAVLKIGQTLRLQISGFLLANYIYFFDALHKFTATTTNRFGVEFANLYFDALVAKHVGAFFYFNLANPNQAIREAYVYVPFPHHRLMVGMQRTLFGYEARQPEARRWLPANPYVVGSNGGQSFGFAFGPQPFAPGIGLTGDWALPKGLGIDYQVSVTNSNGTATELSDYKDLWLRVGGSYRLPRENLFVQVGGSFSTGGQYKAPPYVRGGVDFALDWKYLFASFEYIYNHQFEDLKQADPFTLLPARDSRGYGYAGTLVGKFNYCQS